MSTKNAVRMLIMSALVLAAGAAQAVEMSGYFRDSTGFNSKGGSMACFQMPGTYFKARLGNECDRYLEMDFIQTGTVKDTGDWRVEFMPASYQPTSGGANSLFIQQMWIGLKIPDLGGANLWAGRRYWKRHDVHSLDWFYWNPAQGNSSVGIEDVNTGFGKAAVTLIRMDVQLDGTPAPTVADPHPTPVSSNLLKGTYMVPEVRLYDIPVNPDGTLEVGIDLGIAYDQKLTAADVTNTTFVVGQHALGVNRAGVNPLFTIQHNQANLLGGSNTLAFQYGTGAFAKTTGDGPGQLLAGGTSDDKQWRVIEHLVMNLTPEFSTAVVVVYQDISTAKTSIGGGYGIFSGELRPSYQFNNWFKVSADLFYQTLTLKDAPSSVANKTANLTKVTVAPTFVLGRGYYARPELRIFATYGSWNQGAVDAGGVGGGAFGDSKSGMSYGAQAEIWF